MSDSTTEQRETNSNGNGKSRLKFSRKFVNALGWVITAMWAFSMFFQALHKDYEPPTSIHTLMMIVVATAFGTNFLKG